MYVVYLYYTYAKYQEHKQFADMTMNTINHSLWRCPVWVGSQKVSMLCALALFLIEGTVSIMLEC